jgi:membrane protease YdiL (CAAX protease family)
MGLAAASLAVGLAVALAGATIYVAGDWKSEVPLALPLVLGLLLAALFEELLFRGFPLRQLADAVGKGPAVLAGAAVFGGSHAWNQHAGVLGLVNIGLAGVWLSIAFFSVGGMALAWGLHFGWNLGLAVLNTPISGIGLGLRGMHYAPGGHPWIDGGAFGIEGGIVATLVYLAGMAALIGPRLRTPRLWLA